ncbi:MAG: PD-(D/E)XK nuclease family protein [Endomicrobium sp.]|jgi:RecB family exonuclease|nr:PD-(D/E)XK nuclease family protein [Endomicrobium sp.]
MKRDFRISYSRLNAYLFCPYKYKLIYLDNIRIPSNADITFGHIIHRTLEQFHNCKHNNFSCNKLFELYNDSWKNDGFITPQQIFEYYVRGKKMLKYYYQSFARSKDKIKVLCVEKQFTSNIGKYEFVGIIDRIDEYPNKIYEIIDYKTHSNLWDQKKIDNDLQLSLYAYACRNVFKLNPHRIAIYFLSKNRKIYTTRSDSAICKAIKIALQIAENINIESFNPNIVNCHFCGLQSQCKYVHKV